MLSNVNRWREQMQLPAIGPEELEGDITEIETSDAHTAALERTAATPANFT